MSEAAAAAPPPRRRPGRPRMIEPSEEYLARLEEIIDAAVRVFHDKGYRDGSLDDVAEALDRRKASLYHYFKSKAHLLYLIFDRAITRALERLDDIGRMEDPAARLAALITHQVRVIAEEPGLFAVFFDSRPRLDEAYEQEIRAKERHYVRTFAEAVDAAVAEGVLPPVAARHGAHGLLGMTSWLYKWFDPARDDPEHVAADLVRLVLGDRSHAVSGDGRSMAE